MNIDNLDFVYIIKPNEQGVELRYSLRSIAKHYPNHKVWIVGYKPAWVQNVNFLPVEQKGSKWSNSTNNVIQACKCEEISDEFILMNDDFFCIDPKMPLEDIVDISLNTIENLVKRYRKSTANWAKGFLYINDLMRKMKFQEPLLSYEAHLPIRINKEKFLEVVSLPEVQEFMKTPRVLHKRTLYKNYDRPQKLVKLHRDIKVTLKKDDSQDLLPICGWLSTADGVVGNSKFYNLNGILRKYLSEPCIYESQAEHHVAKPRTITPKKNNKYKCNKYF